MKQLTCSCAVTHSRSNTGGSVTRLGAFANQFSYLAARLNQTERIVVENEAAKTSDFNQAQLSSTESDGLMRLSCVAALKYFAP